MQEKTDRGSLANAQVYHAETELNELIAAVFYLPEKSFDCFARLLDQPSEKDLRFESFLAERTIWEA